MEGKECTAQTRARQKEPDTSRSDVATQSNDKTLDASNYLSYDILRIVFQYLNIRDLQSAAIVCRSWLEAANNEKGMRRGPCCFNIFYKKIEKLRKIQGISDLNIRRNNDNLRIKPLIGFFFIRNSNLYYENEFLCEDLSYYLPEHCEAVMLYSPGIVMDNAVMRNCPALNNIVCAFLPQIPNVKIKFFKMTLHMPFHIQYLAEANIRQDYIEKSVEYQELINTIKYETSRSNYETSTCLMLLGESESYEEVTRHWASTIQHSKEEIKIDSAWGGILSGIQYKTKKHFERMNCIAVLITGVIQTWSVVLDKKCNKKEQVETKLKSFKNKVKLKKHSIGFVLSSISRYSKMSENNVEVTIFKQLFPKVPLVGCLDSSGQFGKTTVVNEQEDDQGDYRLGGWNEDSTVFLILTYGDIL